MKSMLLDNMYQRQDSNSQINILLTMDHNHVAQVVPTCAKYDNIPTFVMDSMSACGSSGDAGVRTVWSTNGTSASFNDCEPLTQTANFRSDAIFTNSSNAPLFIHNTHGQEISTSEEEQQHTMDLNTNLDPRLLDITRQALVNGSLTPLIKEELKCSIQSKRLKEGKQEMKVEFTEPEPDELTPEEVVRVEKRKVQNRLAARRFRDKQKTRAEYLQKQCQQMESVETLLRQELAEVKRERDQLKQAWTEHMSRCPWSDSTTMFVQTTQSDNT